MYFLTSDWVASKDSKSLINQGGPPQPNLVRSHLINKPVFFFLQLNSKLSSHYSQLTGGLCASNLFNPFTPIWFLHLNFIFFPWSFFYFILFIYLYICHIFVGICSCRIRLWCWRFDLGCDHCYKKIKKLLYKFLGVIYIYIYICVCVCVCLVLLNVFWNCGQCWKDGNVVLRVLKQGLAQKYTSKQHN